MMDYQMILDFWFEGVCDRSLIDKKASPFNKWFKASDGYDDEIRHRFSGLIVEGREQRLKRWEGSVQGKLALIILFDQMNRNIHRGTPQMYMLDCRARRLCMQVIEEKKDQELMLIERVFLFMPLMHTEIIDYQEYSVKMFTALSEEAKQKFPHNQDYYAYHLSYAREAYDMINKHGRFLQRDAILGRTDSSVSSPNQCT